MRKIKVKFNLMDLLILLILAAAAAVLLYVFVLSDKNTVDGLSASEKKISYVVEITGLNEEYVEKIAVGQHPVESSKKKALGTVTALESQPYMYTGTNKTDGTLVLNTVDDYITIYATMEANAEPDGFAYAIEGYDIYVGKLIYLSFADIVCSGYCIALDVQE